MKEYNYHLFLSGIFFCICFGIAALILSCQITNVPLDHSYKASYLFDLGLFVLSEILCNLIIWFIETHDKENRYKENDYEDDL